MHWYVAAVVPILKTAILLGFARVTGFVLVTNFVTARAARDRIILSIPLVLRGFERVTIIVTASDESCHRHYAQYVRYSRTLYGIGIAAHASI